MQNRISHLISGCTLIFIGSVITVLFLSSCSKKIQFMDSPVVAAAHGNVKVKKDNNNNYVISVHLFNLAPPDKLDPARRTYIVWTETNGEPAKNTGQINTSTSLLSKRLKASFETVASAKPSRVFISAEDDANAQYPGSQVVLSTASF